MAVQIYDPIGSNQYQSVVKSMDDALGTKAQAEMYQRQNYYNRKNELENSPYLDDAQKIQRLGELKSENQDLFSVDERGNDYMKSVGTVNTIHPDALQNAKISTAIAAANSRIDSKGNPYDPTEANNPDILTAIAQRKLKAIQNSGVLSQAYKDAEEAKFNDAMSKNYAYMRANNMYKNVPTAFDRKEAEGKKYVPAIAPLQYTPYQ